VCSLHCLQDCALNALLLPNPHPPKRSPPPAAPEKQASTMMITARIKKTALKIATLALTFCHHIVLRSCRPCFWNACAAACRSSVLSSSICSFSPRTITFSMFSTIRDCVRVGRRFGKGVGLCRARSQQPCGLGSAGVALALVCACRSNPHLGLVHLPLHRRQLVDRLWVGVEVLLGVEDGGLRGGGGRGGARFSSSPCMHGHACACTCMYRPADRPDQGGHAAPKRTMYSRSRGPNERSKECGAARMALGP